MNVAVVQTSPVFGEVRSNVQKAIELMESVRAGLYVLPELFNTGYNFADRQEVEQLSEPIAGKTFDSVAEFAKERSCYVVYGFAERTTEPDSRTSAPKARPPMAENPKPGTSNYEPTTTNQQPRATYYNSAALVGPEGIVGLYRKVHLYNREHLFFAPGNLGFPVFELPFGKVGIMICYDWIYPESARSLALGGAQLIAHPSNLVMPYCPDAMVTRCLENRVFAVTADRVGEEDRGGVRFRYIGNSEIVSPRGEILTRLGENEPGISVIGIDLLVANNKQVNEFNDLLKDRRADQYTR